MTPGALVLKRLQQAGCGRGDSAVRAGVGWLLGLQNRDGGLPTFCRGWDIAVRPAVLISAHALAAWAAAG